MDASDYYPKHPSMIQANFGRFLSKGFNDLQNKTSLFEYDIQRTYRKCNNKNIYYMASLRSMAVLVAK